MEIDCVVYPPSNPSRQPAGLPRPLCGLSEACLFSSPTGLARKWPSEGNVRHPRPQTPAAGDGREHGRKAVFLSRDPAATFGPECAISCVCFRVVFGGNRLRRLPAFKPFSAAGRPTAASLWPVRSLPGDGREHGRKAVFLSRDPDATFGPECAIS